MLFILTTIAFVVCFFFFSSRRRHTRLQGDWSSDVCSSDLTLRARPARWTLRVPTIVLMEIVLLEHAADRSRIGYPPLGFLATASRRLTAGALLRRWTTRRVETLSTEEARA